MADALLLLLCGLVGGCVGGGELVCCAVIGGWIKANSEGLQRMLVCSVVAGRDHGAVWPLGQDRVCETLLGVGLWV